MTKKKSGSSLGAIIVATIAIAIIAGVFVSYSRQSFEDWIKETDAPVVKHLNAGATLLGNGQYGRAEYEYNLAFKQATKADAAASKKWEEKVDKIPPPRKFYTGNKAARYKKGMTYFKNRMGEAAYGAAESRYLWIQNKYASQFSKAQGSVDYNFAPPSADSLPALKMIDEGLKVVPHSESLRLIKSDYMKMNGMYDSAIAILTELTEVINTQSAEGYNRLALIYSEPFFIGAANGDIYRKKALANFEKATQAKTLDGGKLPDPFYNLGMYYATPPPSKKADSRPNPIDAQKAIQYLSQYIEIVGKDSPSAVHAESVISKLEK